MEGIWTVPLNRSLGADGFVVGELDPFGRISACDRRLDVEVYGLVRRHPQNRMPTAYVADGLLGDRSVASLVELIALENRLSRGYSDGQVSEMLGRLDQYAGGRMINGRYVVGVVGATREIQRLDPVGAITQIARDVGEELTRRQQILLTGGMPSAGIPSPVKSAAMEGAYNAGIVSKPARLVSVLPGAAPSRIEYSDHVTVRHLVINSNMRDARNVINGYIPDVAIGIHGGAGTLSELAVARTLGTPVVLLVVSGIVDTAEVLRRVDWKKLEECLATMGKEFASFPVAEIATAGRNFLEAREFDTATSPGEAVAAAVTLAGSRGRPSSNKLPVHPMFDGETCAQYDRSLTALAQ